MLKNYFLIAIRNILRQKGYSIINIFGLAVGLASVILILLWVKYEFSYDHSHKNVDRIYRLGQTLFYSSGPLNTFSMPGPLSAAVKENFPEVEESFRFKYSGMILRYEEKKFSEEIVYADKELFSVLTVDFIAGDPKAIFDDYFSVVISEKIAKKYFGSGNAIGKVLKFSSDKNFKVSGVFKDIPLNTSLRFDICIPLEHLEKDQDTKIVYGWNSFGTYILLKEGITWDAAEAKLKNFYPIASGRTESTVELWLWPLTKSHLYNYSGGGMIDTIYMFILIASVILIIACINFINLATARSAKRSKEIGLRKVVGANRKQVATQFIGESIFTSFLSLFVAILLVSLILPSFNLFTEKELIFDFADPIIVGSLIALTLFTGMIAGIYPALYLSSFRPIIVLKGFSSKGKSGSMFRKILVVFQFTLSIVLIIGTIIIFKQLSFIQDRDIGLQNDNVIFIRMKGEVNEKFELLKPILLTNPKIEYISRTSSLPFMVGSSTGSISWDGKAEEENIQLSFSSVDYDFEKTMGMKMAEGRYFSEEFGTDSSAVVINENAAKVMGLENPVGSWLSWGGGEDSRFTIIGVVKDYNFEHMSQEISPLVIFEAPQYCQFILIKLNKSDVKATIASIEEKWDELFPSYPFAYTFMDDRYRDMYEREEKSGELFKYFAFLAVFISSLGLFGLTSFLAEQKTREIGIRKVFGSSVSGIVRIMSKEFIILIIIANIIAWPLSWYLGRQLLDGYAYRTEMSWWIFLDATLISFIITFLTISYQSIKAARSNPLDALRYE